MIVTTTTQREMIHWIWLWVLTAIAVSVMQGILSGQSTDPSRSLRQVPSLPPAMESGDDVESGEAGQPIPMPNVDHPEWFRYPNQSPLMPRHVGSLKEILQLQRKGNFDRALQQWLEVKPLAGSETWKQVGIGVALLRLDRLDEAMIQLEKAVEQDANNAVAEYFMGRVRQAQGRQMPFWFESDQEKPFKLASMLQPVAATRSRDLERQERPRSKMLLPQSIDEAYERLAKQHFRQAVRLAPKCRLDQVIRIATPAPEVIQLAREGVERVESITVGDLLDSLDERDYVKKSKVELGAQ